MSPLCPFTPSRLRPALAACFFLIALSLIVQPSQAQTPAVQGIKVPFTTNYIEKVMQEIGVRTKKKGMNWGERGLSAMMRLTLSRFFTPQKDRNYKLALCSNMQVIGA